MCLILTSNVKNVREMPKEAVIVALGIRQKPHTRCLSVMSLACVATAPLKVVGEFLRTSTNRGLKVELHNEAMLVAIIIRPKTPPPRQSHLYRADFLHWCCDVRGEPLWVIDE